MTQSNITVKYDEVFEELWLALYNQVNASLSGTRGFRGATTDQWTSPTHTAGIAVSCIELS